MENQMTVCSSPLVDMLCRGGLVKKAVSRGAKAYGRYLTHGLRDPIFLANVSSGICAGGSLLTLCSSKVAKMTPMCRFSEPLFLASVTLGTISDGLDNTFSWKSPLN